MLPLWIAACLIVQEPEAAQEPLSWKTYTAVQEHVLPAADELGWLEVNWRPVLWDAVAEAREADKPLLIWAMNGHPLGCT